MGKSEGSTFKVDRGGAVTEGGDAEGPEDIGVEGRMVEPTPRGMVRLRQSNVRRGEGVCEPSGLHSAFPSRALHSIMGEATGTIN